MRKYKCTTDHPDVFSLSSAQGVIAPLATGAQLNNNTVEMTCMIKIKTLSALLALTLAAASHAATTRDTWVVNDVYNYNHIYATTDSADLVTKMSTMNSSAYSFYRAAPTSFITT